MKTVLTGFLTAVLALCLTAVSAQAIVVLDPAAGYSITYDGNDGDFFNNVTGATVPDNAALATNGATAFGDPSAFPIPHQVTDLNNGIYGNTNRWIGGNTASTSRAGIALPGLISISSIAWGRDNGTDITSDPVENCGGQCTDRSLGIYTLYHTQVALPDLTTSITGIATTGWRKIGTFEYTGIGNDSILGGLFTPYFRHEYQLSFNGQAILATGFRLDTPVGAAIDEIELYAIPEPATLTLFGLGLLGLGAARRQNKRASR